LLHRYIVKTLQRYIIEIIFCHRPASQWLRDRLFSQKANETTGVSTM